MSSLFIFVSVIVWNTSLILPKTDFAFSAVKNHHPRANLFSYIYFCNSRSIFSCTASYNSPIYILSPAELILSLVPLGDQPDLYRRIFFRILSSHSPAYLLLMEIKGFFRHASPVLSLIPGNNSKSSLLSVLIPRPLIFPKSYTDIVFYLCSRPPCMARLCYNFIIRKKDAPE